MPDSDSGQASSTEDETSEDEASEDMESSSEGDEHAYDDLDHSYSQMLDSATLITALCQSIDESIDDLLRYAALIRRTSKTKSETRADRYSPPESDRSESEGNDVSQGDTENTISRSSRFALYADHVLSRELGPRRCTDSSVLYLKARLKSSMLRRWRRMCYRHAHAKSLASRTVLSTQPGDLDEPWAELNVASGTASHMASSSAPTTTSTQDKIAPPSIAALSSATTLKSDFRVQKPPPAPSETAKSTTRVGSAALSLPPIPHCHTISSEYVYDCPYCGRLPIAQKPLTARSWR